MQENTAPQVVGLESHAFLRALPVALYLLFPYEDGKLGLEAIGNKQLHRGLKLLKQKPVAPAIGDLPLPLLHILHQLSAFLVAHGGSYLSTSCLPRPGAVSNTLWQPLHACELSHMLLSAFPSCQIFMPYSVLNKVLMLVEASLLNLICWIPHPKRHKA